MTDTVAVLDVDERTPWWRRWEIGALVLLVLGIYGARLTALSVRGEESRWARGAVQMIATGDWIVPRQQGQVFPERPPLGSWAMALAGIARGQVDAVAIRFPSVLATLLTTTFVYVYAAAFLSRYGALAAALAYPTMGQVLQLGGLGESEAVFTLFVSASLLGWHALYSRGVPAAMFWTCGYALAALGALTKGIQAPVYFVSVTWLYLLLRRDWRSLISAGHLLGIATFAIVVSAWLIPFYRLTDGQAVRDVWFGLIGDRVHSGGLLKHIATFPLETLACMLPWSAFLFVLALPGFHRQLGNRRSFLVFLLVCLAVTYPSVWFAADARGRYYMPLYPVVACLAGWAMQYLFELRLASPGSRRGRLVWLPTAGAFFVAPIAILAVARFEPDMVAMMGSSSMMLVYAAFAWLCALTALLAWHRTTSTASFAGILGLALFIGVTNSVLVTNATAARSRDLPADVAALKGTLPPDAELVSFGPAFHRFAYYYETPIPQLNWPEAASEVPQSVTYFCYTQHEGDTPQRRNNGRGRLIEFTSGTLPFDWQLVAEVPFGRSKNDSPLECVVVGRIVRDASRVSNVNENARR